MDHIFYPIELKLFVVCSCVLLAEKNISKDQKQKKVWIKKRKEKNNSKREEKRRERST